jgi:ABC-type Mn2+/Zn2+ transport systems, permease components
MIGIIQAMLEHPFLERALIVGILVSLCAALLGVNLVLKQYSMIGDSLSHVSFGALSVAMALGMTPLYVSLPVVSIVAVLLLRLKSTYIKSDAALAVLSSGSLGVGAIVTSLTTGMSMDVCGYMFGSILAINEEDVKLSVILSVAVLIIFVICYNRLFAITFDENFAKASGVNVSRYNTLIALLTAITIVLGMRMMGAMLISSLIIFPALTSMRLFGSFKRVIITAAITSLFCFIMGMMGSYLYSTPPGASIVVVYLVLFGAVILFFKARKYVKPIAMFLVITAVLSGCQSETKTQENTTQNEVQVNEEQATGDSSGQTEAEKKNRQNKEIVQIDEKVFMSQMTEIFANKEDYIGRTVSLEGYMYTQGVGEDLTGGVVRNTPGCCGDDGILGFLYSWAGEVPKANEWLRVTGVLTEQEKDGTVQFVLEAEEVEVLEKRGVEFVTQ